MSRPALQPRASQPRGTAYLAVIGSSMLIAVIGLAAIMAAHAHLRAATRDADFDEARFYARSAVELGRLEIVQDPDWRVNRTSGVWSSGRAVGSGTFTIEGVDPNDNILSNWPSDPLVLTGIGYKGNARFLESVTLVPDIVPLSCLEVAGSAGGSVSFNGATLICDHTFTTNSAFTASSCTIDSKIEAGGLISGGSYLRTTKSAAGVRDLPDPTTLFDLYVRNGTPISFGATNGDIRDVVLSPSNNPYGSTTNPLGIYVLDCAGRSVTVRDCRIVGTLVLINPRSDSRIESSVLAEPAMSNYPVLLVRGSIELQTRDEPLSESGSGSDGEDDGEDGGDGSGRNYNPPGTPYEGVSNRTTVDSYPSVIRGLVYVSGNLNIRNTPSIEGLLVVGGTVTGDGTLRLKYDGDYRASPPPGFCRVPSMRVLLGSWRQVAR